MIRILLPLVILAAACRSDSKALEKQLEDQAKEIRELKALLAKGCGPGAAVPSVKPDRPGLDRAKTYAVPIDGDAVEGAADAKVTLVKVYDYACPYCEEARPVIDQLAAKYGKDLRIVSKHLVLHQKLATASALAYCAAAKQGKGKEMDKALWDRGFKDRKLDNSEVAAVDAGGVSGVKCWDATAGCPYAVGFAKDLGLEMEKFRSDMKNECPAIVQRDIRELQQLGVTATPSFFINGRYLSGALPVEDLSAVIDEELKKATDRIAQGTPAADYYATWVLAKGEKGPK